MEHIDEKSFIDTVGLYIEGLKDRCMRYYSFDHCYTYFQKHYSELEQNEEVLDSMALHLFSYLASWGMMRNEFMIQSNYTLHKDVCEIIAKEMDGLYKNPSTDSLISLGKRIKNIYKDKTFLKLTVGKNGIHMEKKHISRVSDTLVTKILLGTTGLVPAYDRFAKRAMKEYGISNTFNAKSLNTLEEFAKVNAAAISKIQKDNKCVENYPVMKIVDMFLWQKGYELYISSQKKTK